MLSTRKLMLITTYSRLRGSGRRKHQEKECVQTYTIYFVILYAGCCCCRCCSGWCAVSDIVCKSVCFFSYPFFRSKQKRRHYNIAKLLLFQLQLPNSNRILTINFLILFRSLGWIKNSADNIDVLENMPKHICTRTLSHIHAMNVLTTNANEPLK